MATANRPDTDDDELIEGVRRPTGPMTEEEFVAWCDEDVKAEWVDGEVIIMSPSSSRHVRIVSWLDRVMGLFVGAHDLGEVFCGEFTVRLAPLRRRRVPDLFFVATGRLGLVEENHFEGAPDLAVEVVSPDSKVRDRRDKYVDYEAAGVREYWIIDPDQEEWKVFTLDDQGRYRDVGPDEEGRTVSTVLPGFFLRAEWLWQLPLPDEWATLRELGLPG
jgi:Uma2 family endonuclease